MADPTAPPALPPAPPLVGRERERATLREALAQALAGRGSLVLIGGEAGIGKTALADALCAEATERGAAVLVGRCYDLAATPPYGPWAEALARAPRSESPPPPEDTERISPQQEGVPVQVLNGTFTPGLAGDVQSTLENQGGYVQAGDPGDAPGKPIVDSVVYFMADDAAKQNQADAKLLADTYLGGAPVERLPADYNDVVSEAADVIVVLGVDMTDTP